MAKSSHLRKIHKGMVLNPTSKQMEKEIIKSLLKVTKFLKKKYTHLNFSHEKIMKLVDMVGDYENGIEKNTSFISPDGGFLFVESKDGIRLPILISEVKKQGTNDLRLREGKKKQGKGNAIERLGKNVIGIQTWLRKLGIFPFVCFGEGCDFDDDSSIRDRVVTINCFGALNKINVRVREDGLQRGSYFFRYEKWLKDDMIPVLISVAEEAIDFYGEQGLLN